MSSSGIPSAGAACLLMGAFLWAAVIPWLKSAPVWHGWRKFRLLYPSVALIAEGCSALLLWLLFFYCFSNPKNVLSWLLLAPCIGLTLWWSGFRLWHRYASTPLLWKLAEYRDSGVLDEAGRHSLAAAADALDTPFNPRKAEAQIQRLQDVVRAVEHDFVMPVMEDSQAQLAYLQSRILAIILKREGSTVSFKELPMPQSPEVRALWELANHRRALRRIPTQLVKDDVTDMEELYNALLRLQRSGQEFMTLTGQISRNSVQPSGKKKLTSSEVAERIFEETSRSTQIRTKTWKLFAEAEAKLLEDATAGRRSKEDVERDIENLRDLLTRKLEEIDL